MIFEINPNEGDGYMDVREAANETAKELSRLRVKRTNMAYRFNDLLIATAKDLQPMRNIMEQYSIPYRNPFFSGESMKGFVIGEGMLNDKRFLYVFDGHIIHQVDADTDKFVTAVEIETKDYIETCNFEHVKAGFDYVINLNSTAVSAYRERNNEIALYLEENGG